MVNVVLDGPAHYFEIVVLALLQGLTEFLPISSSGHLIVFRDWFGWEDQGLLIDVAVHAGTLIAVVIYFRQYLAKLTRATVGSLVHRQISSETESVLHLVVATLPILVVGYWLKGFIETELRTVPIMAGTTIGFGILLWLADRNKNGGKGDSAMTFTQAAIIGLAQTLALVPGTSRAGVTITCALFLGFSRTTGARFSFLLAIPTISAAAFLTLIDAIQLSVTINWPALGSAMGISFLAAYFTIDLFLRFVEKVGFMPFVIYRIILGSILLISLWLA